MMLGCNWSTPSPAGRIGVLGGPGKETRNERRDAVRRYIVTFFRYWLLVVIPIIVLPLVEYRQIKHTPTTMHASANIYVQQSLVDGSAYTNSWETPAQNTADNINQWLQSPSFDLAVVSKS